jgi:hypothetical protein
MRTIFWSAILSISLAAAFSPTAHAQCYMQALNPADGHRIQHNGVIIELGEADKAAYASAWAGPIQITQPNRKTCAVDGGVSTVSAPLWLGNEHILFVPTFSGYENIVYAINIENCHSVWHSQKYSGTPLFTNGSLVLKDAGITKLDASCLPK